MFKAIVLLFAPVIVAHYCNEKVNQGPYKLAMKKNTVPKFLKSRIETIRYTPETESVYVINAYRSYWRSYCYNGGSIDPNTGCDNTIVSAPPTLKEAKSWVEANMCQVGKDCVNCWGSDAAACFNPPIEVWTGHKELSRTSNNNHFAYHTCNLSWRCGFTRSKLPVFMVGFDEMRVVLPSGHYAKPIEGLLLQDGDLVSYVESTPKLKRDNITLKCVYEISKKLYTCLDEEYGHPITIQDNVLLANVYKAGYAILNFSKDPHEAFEKNWKSAGIGDLTEAIEREIMATIETKFTLLHLISRTRLIEEMITKMVNSLAKIDDYLLSEMYTDSFRTHYVSPNTFLISPCAHLKETEKNCIGNQIFLDGRWKAKEPQDECINITDFHNIELFSPLDFWLPEIKKAKMEGIATDLSGWSFIAQEKSNLQSTMLYTKNGGKGTSIEDTAEWPKGALNYTFHGLTFGLISNFGFTIVVAAIICCFIKKF